jgi:alpha-tubulin suppressor-like RCC1 family protein
MNHVPDDLVFYISIFIPIKNILSISWIDKRFNQLTYNNNEFWKQKFIHDFNVHNLSIVSTNWKSTYQNYGKITVFGSNLFGQLGIGNTNDDIKSWGKRSGLTKKLGDPINLHNPITISDIRAKFVSAGHLSSMIIDLNDNVWTFGENDAGQLGLKDIQNRHVPTFLNIKAKQISTGHCHSLLIDMNDNVWSFGNNQYGQLGLGDDENRLVPIQIVGIKAKSISCGESHSCIVDLEDNVFSFGRNFSGELGLGDTKDRNYPVQITLQDEYDEYIPFKAKIVACGGYHTMMIDLDDNLMGYGNNTYYQLGLNDNNNKLIPTSLNCKAKDIATGGFHTAMIDLEDNVWTFGYNDFGQLGLGHVKNKKVPNKLQMQAKSVIAGYLHTMIIDLEDNIYAFGNSVYNQLGLNDIEDKLIPTKISNLKVEYASGGVAHSIVLSTQK